jgi:5-methylcytosine-specific restriction endonuclease McrBC regulatory subunit McrC
MSRILAKRDLARAPNQTHREFAAEVADYFADHPASRLIQSTVREITELFNEVRFGRVKIDQELSEQIDLSLAELNEAVERQSLVVENRSHQHE